MLLAQWQTASFSFSGFVPSLSRRPRNGPGSGAAWGRVDSRPASPLPRPVTSGACPAGCSLRLHQEPSASLPHTPPQTFSPSLLLCSPQRRAEAQQCPSRHECTVETSPEEDWRPPSTPPSPAQCPPNDCHWPCGRGASPPPASAHRHSFLSWVSEPLSPLPSAFSTILLFFLKKQVTISCLKPFDGDYYPNCRLLLLRASPHCILLYPRAPQYCPWVPSITVPALTYRSQAWVPTAFALEALTPSLLMYYMIALGCLANS